MANPNPEPAALKLLKGRGHGRDSGGRLVPTPPPFKRVPPVKPDDMSDVASEFWDEAVDALEDLDLLKAIDGPALRMACEAYGRWFEARAIRRERGILCETSQGEGVAPWVRVEESSAKEFKSWCAEFGLTPSAEMKLAKGNESGDAEDNPFA